MTNGEFLKNEANEFVKSVVKNIPFETTTIHEFVFLKGNIVFIAECFEHKKVIRFNTRLSNANVCFDFALEDFMKNDEIRKIVANQMSKNVIEAILSISHEND